MTRLRRRDLERGLRLPAPSPPGDLGRRIKDRIPEDLLAAREEPPYEGLLEAAMAAPEVAEPTFAALDEPAAAPERDWTRTATPGRGRHGAGRAAWAMAAAVALALGASYLATRWLETRSTLATDDARVATMAERDLPPERGLRAAAAHDPTAMLAGQAAAPAEAPASVPALAAAAPARQLEVADARTTGEIEAPSAPPSPRIDRAAPPAPAADRAAPPAETTAAEASPSGAEPQRMERRELAERKSTAGVPGGEAAGAGMAQPLAVEKAKVAASSDRGRANGDVVDKQNKQMATVDSARSDAGSFRDALAPQRPLGATVGDLLAAAADRAAPASGSTIAIAGSGARAPGHLVLLVTASLGGEPAAGQPAADPFDLALDRTRVSDWHLLATRTDGDRAVALYDLQLTRELDRTALDRAAALGSVRLRSGVGATAAASSPRPIHAGDFAARWSEAPAELRLATLGVEVASLSPGSPTAAAALDLELARLEAEAALDADAARGAAELRAAVAPAAKERAAAEPASAPAKRDG